MLISVLGSYGEGNFGDEAILAGIQARFPAAKLVCFSHNLELSKKIHPNTQILPMLPAGIRSYWKQIMSGQLSKSIKILRASDKILIGGGGIFYDSKFSKGRNPIKVWYSRTKLLQSFKINFELYAVGVSKLEKENSKKFMKKICLLAKALSVRDSGSEKNLREIGVDQEIAIIKDPGFDFKPDASRNSTGFTVGISLRGWKNKTEFFQKALDELESIEGNFQIKLIPMSVGNDDDRIVLSEFKAFLPSRLQQKTELTSPSTPQAAYQEIAKLDLLIGMRLHSLIFAKNANVRYIPLAYDEKVRNII